MLSLRGPPRYPPDGGLIERGPPYSVDIHFGACGQTPVIGPIASLPFITLTTLVSALIDEAAKATSA
jgi:hypothetical protein